MSQFVMNTVVPFLYEWSITKQDKATKEYLREIQNVNIETGLQNHETL